MNDQKPENIRFPFAQVIVLRPAPGLFTYSVPEKLQAVAMPGVRVVVPFGKRAVIGVVAQLSETADMETKPIQDVLDESPVITAQMLDLIRWTADYYFAPPGEVAALALPRTEARLVAEVELLAMPEKEGKSKGHLALVALEKKGGKRKLHLMAKDIGVTSGEMKKILSGPNVRPYVALRQTGSLKSKPSVVEPGSEPPQVEAVTLNAEQSAAVEMMAPSVDHGGFGVTLLHGVTGSGKTEVYAALAARALALGKSVIVLAPEIAIADMLARRLTRRLGREALLLHSGLTVKERTERWIAARNMAPALVVGARSAVFAPVLGLGLIIVDEEHDPTYKQSETPRYNGRDVAIKRGQIENVPVALGAATPSMESYRNAREGKYRLARLTARIDGRRMPEVEVVAAEKGEQGLGQVLRDEIALRLEAGEQALLFLNRRGTARVVECRRCGHLFQCKNCELCLVNHADQRKIRCHTCGYEEPSPDRCPECDGAELREGGVGTKKIEEEIRELFPNARTERLDRDTAAKRTEPGRILAGMEEGVVDVLVGTQMVTKGHDYAGITLVGMVSADDSLNTPDFRSSERTFQQITQAAGRAGRGEKAGRVVILSRNPEHHSVQAAASHDYEKFYEREAPLREALNYPPFCRMAMIRVEAASVKRGEEFIAGAEPMLRRMERENPGLVRLGPVDAVVFRVKNRYRWKILFKAKNPGMLAKGLWRFVNEAEKITSGPTGRVRLTVDVDPVDVM
ncbi:MAG: primosomal protein N' [Nitrospinota bacterium]|nr:primosomal protein N' [Nitrospinota bacterium]